MLRLATYLFAGLLALLLIVGCSYSGSLGAVQCDEDNPCTDGICEDGYCVFHDDAGDEPEVEDEDVCDGEICDGECVDTSHSTEHCGGCDMPCNPFQQCFNGLCAADCDAGEDACGPEGECVPIRDNDDHCGLCDNTCGDSRTCEGTNCQCLPGLEDCEGDCVDLETNVNHCGICGESCGEDQSCVDGECECDSPNREICDGECVNKNSNLLHCGDCGNECASGQVCNSGVCAEDCDAPTELCEGTCVDYSSDDDHCGDCGEPCGVGETCDGGVCVCTGNFVECNNECVVLGTDENCTACGDTCAADQQCGADGCECLDTNLTNCDGQCVDLQTNPAFCGDCDAPFCDQNCIAGECVPCDPEITGDYGGGSGSGDDPFLICSFAQLLHLADSPDDWDDHFALERDIDGGAISPIGNSGDHFTGDFDGQGRTISDLEITGSGDDLGLFGFLGGGARVGNLILDGVTVSGENGVGALAGRALSGSQVHNVTARDVDVTGEENVGGLVGVAQFEGSSLTVTGSVTGDDDVGGMIGRLAGGLTRGSANVTVQGSGSNVGGLVGYFSAGTLAESEALGDVTNTSASAGTGGLVGRSDRDIHRSRSTGDVTSDDDEVGGIVGFLNNASVHDCYSLGTISGVSQVGGIVGYFAWDGGNRSITDCYVFGTVEAGDPRGGIYGELGASQINIEDSFWNSSVNPDLGGTQVGDADNGMPLPQAEFDDQDNFPWDFTNVWTLHDSDRPRLQWELDE